MTHSFIYFSFSFIFLRSDCKTRCDFWWTQNNVCNHPPQLIPRILFCIWIFTLNQLRRIYPWTLNNQYGFTFTWILIIAIAIANLFRYKLNRFCVFSKIIKKSLWRYNSFKDFCFKLIWDIQHPFITVLLQIRSDFF